MTDSEKIDLILSEIQDMKKDINNLKRQVIKSTAELKAMDEIIFGKVERVHTINTIC